jgi:hypothetical protein
VLILKAVRIAQKLYESGRRERGRRVTSQLYLRDTVTQGYILSREKARVMDAQPGLAGPRRKERV